MYDSSVLENDLILTLSYISAAGEIHEGVALESGYLLTMIVLGVDLK